MDLREPWGTTPSGELWKRFLPVGQITGLGLPDMTTPNDDTLLAGLGAGVEVDVLRLGFFCYGSATSFGLFFYVKTLGSCFPRPCLAASLVHFLSGCSTQLKFSCSNKKLAINSR